MLTITGEVRRVVDDNYNDKEGKTVEQKIVILEPEEGRQNFEVILTSSQIADGVHTKWEKIKGKIASVSVVLYVNYQYRFHKYTATGSGEPQPQGK